jgi:hypothetical protein
VDLHDAKVIGLNGGLQGSRSLAYRFVLAEDNLTSTGFLMVNSSLHKPAVGARLFRGQLVNRDDQEDHHQYPGHSRRPNLYSMGNQFPPVWEWVSP